MIRVKDLKKLLYYDIETHYGVKWEDRSPAFRAAFEEKYWDPDSYENPAEQYMEIAGLHKELSHVICVSLGYWTEELGNWKWNKHAIYGADEVKLLKELKEVFDKFQIAGYHLCGWNNFNCDTPYLVARYIINKLHVPNILKDCVNKPWEQEDVDAMVDWKLGTYRSTSLQVVSAAMGVKVKSDELGGSNLYKHPLDEMPWEELVHYCNEDVEATALVHKQIIEYWN